jgi:alkanesulfonate monooxygenase SsuD/methylene tetrahydromethanopterin reductase-like flavin-dependent oxidoreductase (luciferase family)
MGGKYFGYKGEFYDIPEIKLCPAPSKPVPILIGGHSNLALKRAARVGDGWISAGLSLDDTEAMINKINKFRAEFGTIDHPNFQYQVMGEAAYSPDGVKALEDLGATEVIVAFRNAYEGGQDDRTLEGMIAEINWYAEEVINKTR